MGRSPFQLNHNWGWSNHKNTNKLATLANNNQTAQTNQHSNNQNHTRQYLKEQTTQPSTTFTQIKPRSKMKTTQLSTTITKIKPMSKQQATEPSTSIIQPRARSNQTKCCNQPPSATDNKMRPAETSNQQRPPTKADKKGCSNGGNRWKPRPSLVMPSTTTTRGEPKQ